MITILTQEQHELVQEHGREPVCLVDPVTNEEFVLLRAGTFAKLQALVSDLDPRELYPALHRAMIDEGRDEPKMDEYNRYS